MDHKTERPDESEKPLLTVIPGCCEISTAYDEPAVKEQAIPALRWTLLNFTLVLILRIIIAILRLANGNHPAVVVSVFFSELIVISLSLGFGISGIRNRNTNKRCCEGECCGCGFITWFDVMSILHLLLVIIGTIGVALNRPLDHLGSLIVIVIFVIISSVQAYYATRLTHEITIADEPRRMADVPASGGVVGDAEATDIAEEGEENL